MHGLVCAFVLRMQLRFSRNSGVIMIIALFFTPCWHAHLLITRSQWCSLFDARDLMMGFNKRGLFLKNIIDSPLCTCNSGEVENAYHFFFICQLYNHLRVELRQSIAQYCNMTLDVLLRGDERLSTNINSFIFEAVHKYIQKSKRFWASK